MPTAGLVEFFSAEAARREPGAIDRVLDAMRAHLGVEIAFASRYVDGMRELTHISTDLELPHKPGHADPLEESYCYHVLKGNLPELIVDAQITPGTEDLAITRLLPVGAHLSVPLRLRDGSVYGSFCALSREADPSLNQRDLAAVRAFASLAAELIEEDADRNRERDCAQSRIEAVLAREQLTIVHQPIHALADRAPRGVECLARFSVDDSRTPDLWFAEASEVGLGLELEMLAVRTALRSIGHLPRGLYAAINVSPETAMAPELAEAISGMSRDRLVVEVTEHARVTDYAALCEALDRLRPHARIAIDDVGAGYAGLRHILDLKPDILKLDMSLVRDIDSDPARRALAHAMTVFATDIGAKLVGEGIERAGEADALRALGVEFGQGYHFSCPLPVVAAQRYFLMHGASVDEEPAAVAPPRGRRNRAA